MLKALPRESWDNFGMHAERGKETITHVVRMFAGHDTNHVRQIEGIVCATERRSGSRLATLQADQQIHA